MYLNLKLYRRELHTGSLWHIHLFGLMAHLESEIKAKFPELVSHGTGHAKYLYVGADLLGPHNPENPPVQLLHDQIINGNTGKYCNPRKGYGTLERDVEGLSQYA